MSSSDFVSTSTSVAISPPAPSRPRKNKQQSSHLHTYTAGEDGSRLAEMAKQFGLEHHRKARKQVRDDTSRVQRRRDQYSKREKVKHYLQDHSIEVARMRAAYARQRHTTTSYLYTPEQQEQDDLLHLEHVGVIAGVSSTSKSKQQQQQQHLSLSDMPEWLEAIELEEEDLHAHGVGGDLTSAVLGIIKGMVGPAILYLPHGLARSGYALAIPIMLLVTFLFLFSCQCLLDSWQLEHSRLLQQVEAKLQQQQQQQPQPSQQQGTNTNTKLQANSTIAEGNEEDEDDDDDDGVYEGEESRYDDESTGLLSNTTFGDAADLHHHKRTFFLSYPELAYRALGFRFEQLVKLGITLMQSCVCLTYLIFVPQNFSTAVHRLWGVLIAPEWFLLVMIAVQVPLSWIRDIRKLTATNLLANVLILYGLIVCIALALKQAVSDIPAGEGDTVAAGPIKFLFERFQRLEPFGNEWFLFIGTSVFMFEGSITVLVPLQEAVFAEEDRQKFPTVNRNTILCIITFYIFFSITCWMALGNDVRTVLTTSLPEGAAATTVQLAYSVAVIFTFPLQNYPALEIACRSVATTVEKCGTCEMNPTLQHNAISSVLVVLLALIAATTMESLDKVVSFLGGLLGCPIAFIFPPLIHLNLAGRAGTLTPGRKVMDILVAVMGFIAMVLSTSTTLITG